MSLPLVVEIALGLVFIYLILSLLTSEIQELIATVLQWRAEHLRKSIENLLVGNRSSELTDHKFVSELYSNSLIKSLNQEARGNLAQIARDFARVGLAILRQLTRSKNVFGQDTSGPSYIPSDTFSVALLQTLNLRELSQTISEITAQQFRDENLDALRDILEDLRVSLGDDPFSLGDGSLMAREFNKLEDNLDRSMEDFVHRRASLSDCLEHLAEQLMLFIDNADALLSEENPCKEVVRRRLAYLKRSIARRSPQPTLTEVLRLILAEPELNDRRISPWADEVIAHLHQQKPEWVRAIASLPEALKHNLLSLSEQAHTQTNSLEAEFRQIEQAVAHWFNQSMERASGVYRRNAKGIALLIGFLTAVLLNADTLHMADQLARDSTLRTVIIQSEVQTATNLLQSDRPLPIGWSDANRTIQRNNNQSWRVPFLRTLLGWAITGVALSMGSTFWFDLLSRVVRVRSTGEKPSGSNQE